MSKLAEKVQEDLLRALEQDELVLPTLPEIALRVREAAEDPKVSIADLSRVIGQDVALSARIIKVVNNPLLRTSQEITDLQMAIARLGILYTSNLATGLAMEQMFQATSDVIDRKMRELWASSTEIAGICQVLCRSQTRLMPDQAMLAGLVHQIGALPILTYAEEHGSLLADSISLNHVIERIHTRVGERILHAWDFPEPLAIVPEQHLDFTRDSPRADYVDIVQVALLQHHHGSEHPLAQLDWNSVPAFTKLGLEPTPEALQKVVAEAAQLLH